METWSERLKCKHGTGYWADQEPDCDKCRLEKLQAANTLLLAVDIASREVVYARLRQPDRVAEKVRALLRAQDAFAKWEAKGKGATP